MSIATSIGLVSESLRNLLLGEMRLDPLPRVTLLAPDESGGERRVNLFLYKVIESPYMKNLDWRMKAGSSNTIVPPPLSLNLFYLMTAYATNDVETGNSTAHRMLGEAMRVFHENPVLSRPYLAPELDMAPESIEIVLDSPSMEELAHIWGTFQQPFRTSVLYEISILQLDMLPENERTVAPRVRRIGTPAITTGYRPPSIDTVEPRTTRPGDTIQLRGDGLAGTKIQVMVPGFRALEANTVNNSLVEVTVPDDIGAGLFRLRVDVSGQFRRVFLLEVTEDAP